MSQKQGIMKVIVYVEGGSLVEGKNESVNIEFRKAFRKLAEKLGINRLPSFVPCGGRGDTFDAAWDAFINRSDDELILMLVDGEDASVFPPPECWQHLRKREGNRWAKLGATHKRYIFMMATSMETWLIASVEELKVFFGSCLEGKSINKWPELESVPRTVTFSALLTATAKCGENQYDKGEISFRALQYINPKIVAAKCPHAKHFFARLPVLCETTATGR